MKRVFLFLLICFFTTSAFSLVKIDITRGNLEPLPTAISNFYIDNPEKFDNQNFEPMEFKFTDEKPKESGFIHWTT